MATRTSRLIAILLAALTTATVSARPDATIAGVVAELADGRSPVGSAVVTLVGGTPQMRVSTITSATGTFAFDGLPPGRFLLTVSKNGFLAMAYGSAWPGQAGAAIALASGQHIDDVRALLPRGSVIAGTITDPHGEPIRDLDVHVFSLQDVQGIRSVSAVQVVRTNDLGHYRVFGLSPGDYVLAAGMPPARLGVAETMSTEVVDAELAALARGDRSRPSTSSPSSFTGEPASRTMAPVFYPGAPFSKASVVTLALGEERDGVDWTAGSVPAHVITGRILGADQVASVQVILSGSDAFVAGLPQASLSRTTRVESDHTFRIAGVAPGTYVVAARGVPAASTAPGTPLMWALADATVVDADLTGLTLELQTASSLEGRVVFDTSGTVAPRARPDVRVGALELGHEGPGVSLLSTSLVSTEADGQFAIHDLPPGAYRATVTLGTQPQPSTWWVKSVLVLGLDVLDSPITIGAAERIANVVVTVSNRLQGIAGRIETAAGDPVSGYVALAFPTDEKLWTHGSRRIQSARSATDGRYELINIPAGEYDLCVFASLNDADAQSPSFLRQIAPSCERISLADGERVTKDLKLASR